MPEPQVLEVAIRNSKKEGGDNFEVAKNVSLSNGQTQKVEFDVSIFSAKCWQYKTKIFSIQKLCLINNKEDELNHNQSSDLNFNYSIAIYKSYRASSVAIKKHQVNF